MPILNSQAILQTQTPDGNLLTLPPRDALLLRGPRIDVSVSISPRIGQQLVQQGKTPPAPLSGMAIIDTGAMMTCIDDAVARSMGLPAVDVAQMTSASHESVPQNVYPILVEVIGTGIAFDIERAMGAVIRTHGVILLIGRDALRDCSLFYNGQTGQFSLAR